MVVCRVEIQVVTNCMHVLNSLPIAVSRVLLDRLDHFNHFNHFNRLKNSSRILQEFVLLQTTTIFFFFFFFRSA